MARYARRVRQRARETAIALETVDVGEAEPHSPMPHMVQQSGRHNRIIVDVDGSSHCLLNILSICSSFALLLRMPHNLFIFKVI